VYIGNVYVADSNSNRIRKVTVATRVISTIAGSSTSTGFSNDGFSATSATMKYPYGVAVDTTGKLFLLFIFILSRL